MHKYIVANYKMNGDKHSYISLIRKFNKMKKTDTEVILCPPFLYVPFFTNMKNVSIGVQDVAYRIDDRSTGQISPLMLKDFDIKYVLVGHIERRSEGDTDMKVAEKIKLCCDNGLVPIVCLSELNENDKVEQLAVQVKSVLSQYSTGEILFAYEPILALNSGNSVSVDRINQAVEIIQRSSYEFGIHANVLYGGGVGADNYKELMKANICGFLCGGASLNFDEFVAILKGMEDE